MRKLIAVIGIVISLISSGVIDMYPETATVVDIADDEVLVETFSGNLFSFTGAEDYDIGDTVSMIMYGNFTDSVEDDEIVKVQYSGFYSK